MNSQENNLVLPLKHVAINKKTLKEVHVFSTNIINTSNADKDSLMVLYYDGKSLLSKNSSEFSESYTIKNTTE